VIGVLGAFLPVGDMVAMAYSESIPGQAYPESGTHRQRGTITVMSGKAIRDGFVWPELFATVSDLAAQAPHPYARADRYNCDGNAYDQWPYPRTGTADVDMTAFDDFVEIVGFAWGLRILFRITDTPRKA